MEHVENKASKNIIADNIEKLKALFPEAFTESSDEGEPRWKVDFETLKQILGDYSEDTQERYSFSWNGKSRARLIAQTPSTGTLRPCPEESVDWDTTKNLFIEGDNLEVLKLLQKSYHKKVKMIYIDPPYNTGNEFIYPDKFQDNLDTYLRYTGQVDDEGFKVSTNSETGGRYHTNWLNMMYPRLKLARNLLREDGVLCLSIDENEISNLRKLCNEVFGEENFLFQITLLCNPKGRSQDKYIANCHEYILGFSKQMLDKGSVNIPKRSEEIEKNYKLVDNKGRYRELELRNTHRDFGKHNRTNLYYPFYVDGDGNISLEGKSGFVPVFPIWDDGFEGCWTWGKEKAKKQLHELVSKKIKGNWKIYRKNYVEDDNGKATKQVKSIWIDKKFHTEKGQDTFNSLFETNDKIFQSPKSIDTIKQLLLMGSQDESLVLDFFAGSATTAHSVIHLNSEDGGKRKFIMVQLPEPTNENSEAYKAGYKTIAEIGKERIRRAGKKIREENPDYDGDLGFKVFKLDSSNIKPWDAGFDNYKEALMNSVENIKTERTEQDVLYELLLKYGLDLTIPIETRSIQGKNVYIIGAGALVVCLDDEITLDAVEGIAKLKEELKPEIMRVVFKDAGFKDATVKTNTVQLLKIAGIEDVKSL